MSDIVCMYHRTVSLEDLADALIKAECHHCGISAMELIVNRELLEICGAARADDTGNGGCMLAPIALCPTCHRDHHLDLRRRHDPCKVKAHHGREALE